MRRFGRGAALAHRRAHQRSANEILSRCDAAHGTAPLPAPSLVHLDVDDNAFDHIGHWPWPPTTLARMVEEPGLAQPKVLALDVLFADPSCIVYGKNDSTGVDGDQVQAAAIRRVGCAVVPMSLKFDGLPPPAPYRARLLPLLTADPERSEADCLDLLRADRVDVSRLDRNPLTDSFQRIRESALHDRIEREVAAWKPAATPPEPAAIRRSVLSHADPLITGSLLGRLFDQQFDRAMRKRAARRFTLPVPVVAAPFLQGAEFQRFQSSRWPRRPRTAGSSTTCPKA